jgi:hypothetical protein
MRSGWAPILALALVGCGNGPTRAQNDRWCEEFYARFDISDYVDQRTGRINRDPTTNEVTDPETGRIALTRREEQCVQRQAQRAIDRYEGNGH